jgi:integrase
MANTTNIIPNKLTMYQRVEGGVWHYRIKLKTGEWYRLSSRETDFDAAKEIANRTYYTADYKEKNRLPQTTRKFKNVAKYALTRLEDELEGGGGKVVYKDYIRTINNYLIPFFGKYDIANITIKLLSEYADWRDVQISLQKNRRKTTQIKKFRVSQSTINTHNSALNRVFDEAMLHGWITESIRPTLLNKGIKSESRGAFSEKEYKAIYTKLRTWWQEGHRQETRELRKVLREYVLFLGNTGIRHGTESITLKWNNLEHYIDENKDKYLLINKDIQKYLESNAERLVTLKSPLIYSQRTGGHFSSQTLQILFKTLYSNCGINASSHSGRRKFITDLSEKGVSVRVIQELARHRDLATTQRYIDVSVDKLRNAVNLVGL